MLFRSIKLAAIRRVLASFLARSPMSEVLSSRDFASVEEVMDVAGATDAEGRDVAVSALQSFRPGLIVNRVSRRSHVNVLYLRKILQDYVGGDLMLLGEIPEDPAVSEAVRNFLPVVEAAPESAAAKGLVAVADAAAQLITACTSGSHAQQKREAETETGSRHSVADLAVHVFTTQSRKPRTPLEHDSNASACAEPVPSSSEVAT